MPILLTAYAAIAYAAFRYPYIVLMCFILGSRFGDSFGVGSYVARAVFPYHDVMLAGLTFVASIVCTHAFLGREKCMGLNRRRSTYVVGAAYLFCGWILFSSLLLDKPIGPSVTHMLMSQGFVIPIVLRYAQSRRFRLAVIICVAIQLVVAAMIVLVPSSPFSIVATARYKDITVSPYEQFEGLARYYGARKLAAQFFNANAYGFYATASLVISFMALYVIKRRWLAISVFSLVMGFGLFGQVVTMARGCMVGLFIGCVLGLIAWLRIARLKSMPIAAIGAFILLFLLGAGFVARDAELRSYLVPGTQSTSITTRTGAIDEAIDIIAQDPILGNGDPEGIGTIAHVTPLFFAEVYGIPAGFAPLLMIVLFFAAFLGVVIRRRRVDTSGSVPYLLDFVAGMVGIGMWLSNGSGGVVNWLVITLAILPWLRITGANPMSWRTSPPPRLLRPKNG